MKYLKNVGMDILIMTGLMLIFTLLITTFSYFNWIGKNMVSISEMIIPVICLFTGGIWIGKRSTQKGWLEGIKISLIYIVLLMLLKYLGFHSHIVLKNFLYYGILMISCVFGSMIGINKRKLEN